MAVLIPYDLRNKIDLERPFRFKEDHICYQNFNKSTKKLSNPVLDPVSLKPLKAKGGERFVLKEIAYQKSPYPDNNGTHSLEILRIELDSNPGKSFYITSANEHGNLVWSEYPTILESEHYVRKDEFEFKEGIYVSTLQIWINLSGLYTSGDVDVDGLTPIIFLNENVPRTLHEKNKKELKAKYGKQYPELPRGTGNDDKVIFIFTRFDWYLLEDFLQSRAPKDPKTLNNPFSFPDPSVYQNAGKSHKEAKLKEYYINLSLGLSYLGFPVFNGLTLFDEKGKNLKPWQIPTKDQLTSKENDFVKLQVDLDKNCQKAIRLLKSISLGIDVFEKKYKEGEYIDLDRDGIRRLYPNTVTHFLKNTPENRELWKKPSFSWGLIYGAPWKGFIVDPFIRSNYTREREISINVYRSCWGTSTLYEAIKQIGRDNMTGNTTYQDFITKSAEPFPIYHISKPLGGYLNYENADDFQTGNQFSAALPISKFVFEKMVQNYGYKTVLLKRRGFRYSNIPNPIASKDLYVDQEKLKEFLGLMDNNIDGHFFKVHISKSTHYLLYQSSPKTSRCIEYRDINSNEIKVELNHTEEAPELVKKLPGLRKCWNLNLLYRESLREYYSIERFQKDIPPMFSSLADLVSAVNKAFNEDYTENLDLPTIERYSKSKLAEQKRVVEKRALDLVEALHELKIDLDEKKAEYDKVLKVRIDPDLDITYELELLELVLQDLEKSQVGQKYFSQEFKIWLYYLIKEDNRIEELDDELSDLLKKRLRESREILKNYKGDDKETEEVKKKYEQAKEYVKDFEEFTTDFEKDTRRVGDVEKLIPAFYTLFKSIYKSYKKWYAGKETLKKATEIHAINTKIKLFNAAFPGTVAELREKGWEVFKHHVLNTGAYTLRITKMNNLIKRFGKINLANRLEFQSEIRLLERKEARIKDLRKRSAEIEAYKSNLTVQNSLLYIFPFIDVFLNPEQSWPGALKATHELVEHLAGHKKWLDKTWVRRSFKWGRFRVNIIFESIAFFWDLYIYARDHKRYYNLGRMKEYYVMVGNVAAGGLFLASGLAFAIAKFSSFGAIPVIGWVLFGLAVLALVIVLTIEFFWISDKEESFKKLTENVKMFFSKEYQKTIQTGHIKILVEGKGEIKKLPHAGFDDVIKLQLQELSSILFNYGVGELKYKEEEKSLSFEVELERCFTKSIISIDLEGLFIINGKEDYKKLITTGQVAPVDVLNKKPQYQEYTVEINEETRMVELMKVNLSLQDYARPVEIKDLVKPTEPKIRLSASLDVFQTKGYNLIYRLSEPVETTFQY